MRAGPLGGGEFMTRQLIRLALGLAVIATALSGCNQKVDTDADKAMADAKALVKEREAKDTAIEGYIYAYPLVTMELTRRAD